MSVGNADTAADQPATCGNVTGDPWAQIRSLATENEAGVRRARSALIPQHIGMAAACRALAVELPRALAARIDEDLKSGVLAQRWDAVRTLAAEAGAGGEPDPTLTAIAALLREHGRAVMRHLVQREKAWAADAYRLEGQADALEAQLQQLRQVLAAAPTADTRDTPSGTVPLATADLDARPTAEPELRSG
jgi:hypothetical protein